MAEATSAARTTAGIDESVIADLERRTAEVCAALERSHRLQDSGDPLYALPWFLVMGDSRPFLTAASRTTSFPRPPLADGAEPPPLSWWLTDTLVAAALGPGLTQAALSADRDAWRGLELLLALIVRHRPLRPLDGLVVTIPADSLSKDPDSGAANGRLVRRIADEWQRSVGFRLPVFVIVTGLETLTGHGAMVAALPREIGEKAVGVRLDHALSPEGCLDRLSHDLDGLEKTLARLRLGLLLAGGDAVDRRGVFRFPVEFAGLRRGLTPMVEALLVPNDALHPALLRAVYFASTGGSGAHLDDITQKLLSADAAVCCRA